MKDLTRRALAGLCALTAFAGLPALAQQDFPNRPVRIITPFPVGGGPEAVVRQVADKLSRMWKQPVVVENRPGGNGFIAIDAWKRGSKDGYDLLQVDNVHLSAYPALFKKLPYDPVKDFDPLLPLFKAYFFFTVATDSKYKSVGDIVADAKANPGKLSYGSWSIGNPVHLGSEMFESLTGTDMAHVVYKETSQLYTDVATQQLSFALGTSATAGAMQRAGRIRYLAVAGPERVAAFPNVPTSAESGGPADLRVLGWTAIVAPKGLLPEVAEKIRRDITTALAEPDIAERYRTFGYDLFPQTREQFNQFIRSEQARFSDVIRKANISLD
ncbi:MAG: tripartite tricarboxylate transporter substrate binding protein [Xylophilus ampelinus]